MYLVEVSDSEKCVKSQSQNHWYKGTGHVTRNTDLHGKYKSPSTNCSNIIGKDKVLSNSQIKLQGKNFWYPKKSFVPRNTPVKYKISGTNSSKVQAKVKVFKKYVKL